MEIRKAAALQRGDRLCVVSPSSPSMTDAYLDRGLARLRRAGFDVVPAPHLGERRLLFGGSAEARVEDLHRAFADPDIGGIICVRGGVGSLHLLPLLDYGLIARNPKVLIGYSDVTALQCALFQGSGLITFYGPMVAADFGKTLPRYSEESLLRVVGEKDGEIELQNPPGAAMRAIVPGRAEGRLAGGCLSLVVSTLGTPFEVDTRDRILFFEDVEERPHRIDRFLTQLALAGKFEAVRGIIFGTFHRSEYRPSEAFYKYGVTVLDVIRERIEPLGIPAVYGLQFGHVRKKLTIPYGAMAVLDAAACRVVVEPSVV